MIKNQNHLGAVYMIMSVLFFSFMDILIKLPMNMMLVKPCFLELYLV